MGSRWIREAGWLAVLLLILGLGQDYLFLRPNRRAFIGIMSDLGWGMTREEVNSVLARHRAARLIERSEATELFLAGQTGLARWWQLSVAFQEGHLTSARVWTEDGPYHPADVPPDITGPAPGAGVRNRNK